MSREGEIERFRRDFFALTNPVFNGGRHWAVLSFQTVLGGSSSVGRILGFGHHLFLPLTRPVIAVDVSPWIDKIMRVGAERDAEKTRLSTTRLMTKQPHGVSLFGEVACAVALRLDPDLCVDWTMLPRGDSGADFFSDTPHSIDVKTCSYPHCPYLKEYTSKSKADVGKEPFSANWYVLAAHIPPSEDGGRHSAIIYGHTSKPELQSAELIAWKDGSHAGRHSLGVKSLHKGLPPHNAADFDAFLEAEVRARGLSLASAMTLESTRETLWPGMRLKFDAKSIDDLMGSSS